MAYNNPILGAVQTNQAAQMQNKQFEASFGLRLAQFAENRKNTAADETYRQKARDKSLLGIVPGEEEGVNAICYLLQSRYLTGKTIALDGGRHLARAS